MGLISSCRKSTCSCLHTLHKQLHTTHVSLLNSCHLYPPLQVPHLTLNEVRNTTVEYQTQRNDNITIPLVAGYEVTRFGLPMIGQYVSTGTGREVTISPVVPGAQYRITAWALGNINGTRSVTPAVVNATTGEASKCSFNSMKLDSVCTYKCMLHIYVLQQTMNSCRTSQLRRKTIYWRKGAVTELKPGSFSLTSCFCSRPVFSYHRMYMYMY